jgi:hypothetical protein
MNRNHTRQLAELALATRDTDLLAKACQQLLAEIDMPVTLPLFQQPALAAADQVAALDRALDNLPPVVYHQAPVQRVEVDYTQDWYLNNALRAWCKAFGDAWRTNSEAVGAHQHVEAMHAQLHTFVQGAVQAGDDVPARTRMRLFWALCKVKPVEGYRVEHRQRDMGGYRINEHRVIEVQG